VKKIIYFVEECTLAHFIRSNQICNWLKDNYDVTIITSKEIFKWTNVDVKFIESKTCVGKETFLKNINNNKPIFSYQLLHKQLAENRFYIDKLKPDYVFGDMRLSLLLNKKIDGNFLYYNATNSYWNPQCHLFNNSYLPMPYTKHNYHFSRLAFAVLKKQLVNRHTKPFNDVLRDHKIAEQIALLDLYYSGDYRITVDDQKLFPSKSNTNTINIGNLRGVRLLNTEDYYEDFDVFVNLGSSLNEFLIDKVVQYAEQVKDVKFLVATLGKKVTIKSKNIKTIDYPDNELLSEKSKLFINNGGIMSVGLCIDKNINQLCIPHNFDQHIICETLHRQDLIRYIRSDRLTCKNFKENIYKSLGL